MRSTDVLASVLNSSNGIFILPNTSGEEVKFISPSHNIESPIDSSELHQDLILIELMMDNVCQIRSDLDSLDHCFSIFANLLHKRHFDPHSGLYDIVSAMQHIRDEFRYSGYLECLLGVLGDLQLVADPVNRKVTSTLLGDDSLLLWRALIAEVRSRSKSRSFIQRSDQRRRRSIRRKAVMESYVLKVLEKYKRLLVLRVDFGYLKDYAPYVSEQEARADLARLFANRRHNQGLLPDLVGYVCCIEWAQDARYHFHVLFMLDGNRRRSDVYLAQQVGRYWVDTITKGRGRFYNCNLSKHHYQDCGVGLIHWKRPEQVTSLVRDALGYLLNKEQYLVAKRLEHSKTVFRGVLT